jgi:hypothetical protein
MSWVVADHRPWARAPGGRRWSLSNGFGRPGDSPGGDGSSLATIADRQRTKGSLLDGAANGPSSEHRRL